MRLSPLSLSLLIRCVHRVLALVLAPAFVAALTTMGGVAPYRWENVPIEGGGFVTGLVYHPIERDLFYARTDVGGAYRWDETKQHWVALNDAIGAAQAELHGVLSLALDRSDPNRVYLAAGSYTQGWASRAAFVRSADRGRTWETIPLPFKLGGNEDGRSTGERLQVDPFHPTTLLLGSSLGGLWQSDDRGSSWRQVTTFLGKRITWTCFDSLSRSAGPTPRYVGLADPNEPAIWRSVDGGKSWNPLPGQPSGLVPHHAAFDASGILYFTFSNGLGPNDVTDGAVWSFNPRNGAWKNLTPVKPNAIPDDRFGYAGLAVAPTQSGVVLVSTLDRWRNHDEIFRTADGGATWAPLLAGARWDQTGVAYISALTPHWIGAVTLDPFDGGRAWFVTGYGVWRTNDLGKTSPITWQFADAGLEETVIEDLVSPSKGAPVLSAVADLGGFRHDDLDHSPEAGMFRPFQGSGTSIAVAANVPEVVVRTMNGSTGGAISRDGGMTWTAFASVPAGVRAPDVGALALSAEGRRILWQPKASPPFVSSDDGKTWRKSAGGFVATADFFIDRPVADAVNPQRFYLYDRTRGRVYASGDDGDSFTPLAEVPVKAGTLRSEPNQEGVLWLPSDKGLLVSMDGGRSFQRLTGVTSANQIGFGHPAPNARRAAIFLVGTIDQRSGVFRSDDQGASWLPITDEGHAFGWIRVLTGDARVYGRVYLGTSGRGILRGDPTHSR